MERAPSVDLYWLPLGAGDTTGCVRWNGRVYEAVVASHERRQPCDLYHSALEVCLGADRFVIEMTPVWGNGDGGRGVVSRGPVGYRWLGCSRAFRYEVRRWRNGRIPGVSTAVASPQRVSTDPARAERLLDLVPSFPTLTWGRDELHIGDMWNSNSLIAWLLAASGHQLHFVEMPLNGRAPGWTAGLALAARDGQRRKSLPMSPSSRARRSAEAELRRHRSCLIHPDASGIEAAFIGSVQPSARP